jgi:hypothetical protein
LEEHEETIEEWYAKYQDEKPLQSYLCRQHVLPKSEQKCLNEKVKGEKGANKKNEL